MALATALISGAGIGGLYLFRAGLNPTTEDWGRASQYGLEAKYQRGAIAKEYSEEMSLQGKGIVAKGTRMHEEIQKQFQKVNPNIIDEYAIWDPKAKLTGHIDMLVPMDIEGRTTWTPTEIKTISSAGLKKLSAPKKGHRAQAQFYLHYLAKEAEKEGRPVADFEQFIYASRDDPTKYKSFTIKRSEEEFQFYLARYRAYQKEMKAKGATFKPLTSHFKVLKDVAEQRVTIRLDNLRHPSESPPNIEEWGSISRDVMAAKYGYKKPAVENYPRRIKPMEVPRLSMSNYRNAKYGPQMQVHMPRLNYNEGTQSRLSGVVA